MSKHSNVLYLISRENVLEPGVLESQVFDVLGEITRSNRKHRIKVLDLPSINRFLRFFKNYQTVRRYSVRKRVGLVVVPILPIGRSIMPIWAIPFFLIQAVPVVLFFVIKDRINVIHARAYLSALVCWFLRTIGVPIKFVFDMRGLYLLEGITYGRWDSNDLSFKFWLWLERILLRSADVVVLQSSGMGDYVHSIASDAQPVIIPPCVGLAKFAMAKADRERRRRRLGLDGRFVVVYSGSLGSFHEPSFLARTYGEIRKFIQKPSFLVVTHSDPGVLVESLKKLSIPEEEFKIVKSPTDLGEFVSLGDVGLHVMEDLPITPTVVSVKFGEYLASGLPVIVTKNMTSVTNLVDEHHCGVVVEPFDRNDIRVKIQELIKRYGTFRKKSLKLAKDYFSVEVCADRYLRIYEKLARKN